MKIFQIHNKYRYFGGEDSVVDEEAKLLTDKNHQVVQLIYQLPFLSSNQFLIKIYLFL